MPAMLHAQSRPPNRSTANATIASTAASSATSTLIAAADAPASAAVARARLFVRRRRRRPRCHAPRAAARSPRRSRSRPPSPVRPSRHQSSLAEIRTRTHDETVLALGIAGGQRDAWRRPSTSTGSHHSGGRSITAVAPSVATARSGASAFTAMPVPRSSVANEIVSRSSAALLGAYVDERACCGLSSWFGVDDRTRDVDDPARAALAHRRARPPSSAGTA